MNVLIAIFTNTVQKRVYFIYTVPKAGTTPYLLQSDLYCFDISNNDNGEWIFSYDYSYRTSTGQNIFFSDTEILTNDLVLECVDEGNDNIELDFSIDKIKWY